MPHIALAAVSFASLLCLGAAHAQDHTGMTLDICPNNYNSFPADSPPLTCGCSAEQAKADETIWGANPYQSTSSLCRAAVHAGAIDGNGGKIVVHAKPDVAYFASVRRNGIESASSTRDKGFTVDAALAKKAAGPFEMTASGMTLDICPVNLNNYPEDGGPLACGCSPEQAKADDTVWGANPYQSTSSICRAAVHAGAIGKDGGSVTVKRVASVPVFPSVTRNGVESASTTSDRGFAVDMAAAPSQTPKTAQTAAGSMRLDICPNDYNNFPMDTPPLICGCSAEQAKANETIWGANPYQSTSSICRAAVHAGVLTLDGGEVVVTPESNVPVFPSVTRKGIESASATRENGFKVSAVSGTPAQKASVDQSGKPVQAPIAETLKATGRVQLYVNFATDQAVPLPSSTPVLMELLAALQNDPALKLELIGHTDSQGGADYNLDLSQRRAAGIYYYLVKAGVDASRLKSSGHGLVEPIADNATDEGRALNRRVEAKQMQ